MASNYTYLGNVSKMTDKDIHLTISDLTFSELMSCRGENAAKQANNSLIISSPQKYITGIGNVDNGYFSIFASDYKGNLCPLVPFNQLNSNDFKIEEDITNGSFELSLIYGKSEINTYVNSKVSNLEAKHDRDKAALDTAISNLEAKHDREKAALDNAISNLEAKHDRDKSTLEGNISNLRNDHNTDMSNLRTQHNNDISNLRTQHNNDISNLRTQHNNDINSLINTINALRTQLNNLEAKHDRQKEQIQRDLNELGDIINQIHNGTYIPNFILSASQKPFSEDTSYDNLNSSYENLNNNTSWEYNF